MVVTAQADPLVGSMLGKDYKVLEQIGMGGMAVVYLVEHQTLLKQFAAKVLSQEHTSSSEARARFTQEAHAASQLDHENIVRISDFGISADQRPYFVMELLRGQTLADRLDEGPMTLEEVVAVSVPIGRALAHAHAEGIIHRDIKPENVFLVQRSQNRWGVKVLDFGIAKVPVNDRMTKTGQALGSPMFMSPEACRGDDVDQRADVYSFGILLYLMLVGRVPFNDSNLLKVLQMQVSAPLPLPSSFNPDLPPSLEAILISALAKDPEGRYPTIEALMLDFEAALPEGADLLLLQAQLGATPFPGSLERVRTSARMIAVTGQHNITTTGQHNITTGQHLVTITGRHDAASSGSQLPRSLPAAPQRRSGWKAALVVLVVLALAGGGAFAYLEYGRTDETTTAALTTTSPPAAAPPPPVASPKVVAPVPETPDAATASDVPVVDVAATEDPADAPAAIEPEKQPDTQKVVKRTPKQVVAIKPPIAKSNAKTPPTKGSGSIETGSGAGSGSETAPPPKEPASGSGSSTEQTPPAKVDVPTPPIVKDVTPPVTQAPPPPKLVGSLDATPSIGGLDVSGSLPSSVVRRGVERLLPALRDCYRIAAKTQQATPAASVTLSFEIDEGNSVRSVSAKGGFGSLGSCVRGTIGRVKTGQAPDVGTVHVVVSIKFTPI